MKHSENIIEAKNLFVSFYIQNYGVNSLKDVIISLGRKKPLTKKEVLNDISFTIKKGEAIGVLGKNGSGKSTLLRVLSGIIKPERGELIVNGKIAPLLALGVGLEPDMSGYENIKLLGLLSGYSSSKAKGLTQIVQDFSELSSEALSMEVKRYSSGMISRLGFAIATAYNPEILIIDEALSVGDLFFREKCYNRILEIKKSGSTILFVSQEPSELKKICDKGLVMENGRVLFFGDITDAEKEYLK